MKRARAFSFSGAVLLFYLFAFVPSAFASHLDSTFWDLEGTFNVSFARNTIKTPFTGTFAFMPDRTFTLEGTAIGLPMTGAWFDKGKRGFVLFSSNVLEVVEDLEEALESLFGFVRIDLKTMTMKGKVNRKGNQISGTTVIKGTLRAGGRTVPLTMTQKYKGELVPILFQPAGS